MKSIKDKYPVFEANQVLTNNHLNQVYGYLDEQERLTRANLIGIGIVCGLEIGLETGPVVRISKGCGITSEGYLILLANPDKPEDDLLFSLYKKYTLPKEIDYPPFKDYAGNQYNLLELFEKDEPDGLPLSAIDLQNKAVLLFLELKKDDLRNCSPNNCDDRGAEVMVTVRKLLIDKADLKKIIAVGNSLNIALTPAQIKGILEARLGLPNLRLPRYNVTNTEPVTSLEVLTAFFQVFNSNGLAKSTGDALEKAYNAFKPVLENLYPTNPFTNFKFDYFDTSPKNVAEVRFLQYFYDLFDDLIKAYDEFRWKGIDLMCACCASEKLFPRHLDLGLLFPDSEASIYRHNFLASAANSGCEQREEELRMLFQRMVEMTEQFTVNPSLQVSGNQIRLVAAGNPLLDDQIRITPSQLADVSLSNKAIPFYYINGSRQPLYQIWNEERTRRLQADQNLSYWAANYSSLAFVKQPLRYDLEPYNFLRIEGHLGKKYTTVLRTLLHLRELYRLPIAIVALRAGVFDATIAVDPAKESCRFEDLEALYDALKIDLQRFLFKSVDFIYKQRLDSSFKLIKTDSDLPLIQAFSPTYPIIADSVGGYFENQYQKATNKDSPIDKETTKTNEASVSAKAALPPSGLYMVNRVLMYNVILSLEAVFEALPENLSGFVPKKFSAQYAALEKAALTAKLDWAGRKTFADTPEEIAMWDDVDDQLDAILIAGRSDAFKSIYAEYQRRITELKQKQFLSTFLKSNPGIQHKAGVPMGGTFIIVYNDDPDPVPKPFVSTGAVSEVTVISGMHPIEFVLETGEIFDPVQTPDPNVLEPLPSASFANRTLASEAENEDFTKALLRIGKDPKLMASADVQYLYGKITGQIPIFPDLPIELPDPATLLLAKTIDEMADETVIADFFLPYLCCSDCSPIQFVLPFPPVSFTFKLDCTDPISGKAAATLTPLSGTGPYAFKLDKEEGFKPLLGAVLLTVDTHTLILRDANGVESVPMQIKVEKALLLGAETYECFNDEATKMQYEAKFEITGGTLPYTADSGKIELIAGKYIYTSIRLDSGEKKTVTISDGGPCKKTKDLVRDCPLPKPVFTVDPFCTPDSGPAIIQLKFTSGKSPYKYKLGNGDYTNLSDGGILLASNEDYKIVVKDGNDQVSDPVDVHIPAPLLIGLNEKYKCQMVNGVLKYTVSFDIQGGTGPYKADKGTVTNLATGTAHFISDPINNNEPLTVIVTDKFNCVRQKTFLHGCVKPSFNLDFSFDTNGKTRAAMKVLTGTEPYKFSIDGAEPLPLLKDPIIIPSGLRTVQLFDAEGLSSEEQKIQVPAPMSVSEPKYTCITDANGKQTYSVSLDIIEGIPPFNANIGTIKDRKYTSALYSSGAAIPVKLSDHGGSQFANTYTYECLPPCDLPCEGLAKRSMYRFWVQQPSLERQYTSFVATVKLFAFDGPNGPVDLTNEVGEIIKVDGVAKLNENYESVINGWIQQLNAAIAKKIDKTNWLMLAYSKTDKDPFGVLRVERFECHRFDFRLDISFTLAGGATETLNFHYIPEKTFVTGKNLPKPAEIPAFAQEQLNKCDKKQMAWSPMCAKAPSFQLTIKEKKLNGMELSLTAEATGEEKPAFLLWEIEDGSPSLANGEKINIIFQQDGGPNIKHIRLTAFSKTGCSVVIQNTVDLSPDKKIK